MSFSLQNCVNNKYEYVHLCMPAPNHRNYAISSEWDKRNNFRVVYCNFDKKYFVQFYKSIFFPSIFIAEHVTDQFDGNCGGFFKRNMIKNLWILFSCCSNFTTFAFVSFHAWKRKYSVRWLIMNWNCEIIPITDLRKPYPCECIVVYCVTVIAEKFKNLCFVRIPRLFLRSLHSLSRMLRSLWKYSDKTAKFSYFWMELNGNDSILFIPHSYCQQILSKTKTTTIDNNRQLNINYGKTFLWPELHSFAYSINFFSSFDYFFFTFNSIQIYDSQFILCINTLYIHIFAFVCWTCSKHWISIN